MFREVSVRVFEAELKAERCLAADYRREGRQVARLDRRGVAQIEEVEQVDDHLQMDYQTANVVESCPSNYTPPRAASPSSL